MAIPAQLDALADAWRETSAWQGRVSAGGVEMDAPDNAVVASEELTVHGWDLARATGQDLRIDNPGLDQVERFFELFGGRPFGPAVDVPDDATRMERTIARTGLYRGGSQSADDSAQQATLVLIGPATTTRLGEVFST